MARRQDRAFQFDQAKDSALARGGLLVTLTKRERVLRTIRFEETDRVPTYDLLQNDATIEYCSGRALTTEDGDWTVGVAVGRCLDMTRSVGAPSRPETIKQPDGFTVRRERWTGWIIERPFCDLDGLIAWVKKQIIEINARVFDAAFVRKVHDLVRRRPD